MHIVTVFKIEAPYAGTFKVYYKEGSQKEYAYIVAEDELGAFRRLEASARGWPGVKQVILGGEEDE
jgi:hypothetical protein